uniref:hypothetical protein n=1 Tax=Campylobacter fetus TaxID=196 RepID=UPI0013D83C70
FEILRTKVLFAFFTPVCLYSKFEFELVLLLARFAQVVLYNSDDIDDSVIFQGDETSQNRIARALSVASSANLTSTLWTAKNNKVYELKIEQL